jgi:hypothetical protein
LLTRLHHPLHHVLHPNRRLTGVLLLRPSQLPGFALVSATLIGWYKPLLRPLTLRSMKPKGLELMSWCLIGCLMPRSLMLSCRYSAILSLSRHFFLGFGLLCFQEGALRPYMPIETAVMANRRSSDGMRRLSAWNIIIDLYLDSNELFSVCRLFRSLTCCFRPSLSFSNSL